MKNFIKLSILLLTILLPANATAYDFEVDGIYYNIINDNEVEVTYDNGNFSNGDYYVGDVVIPTNISYNGNTYSVTEIGQVAFAGCSQLTSINIPNTIKTIRLSAFIDCTSLVNIIIPKSVTSIETVYVQHVVDGDEEYDFYGDPQNPFTNCYNLSSIIVESGNPIYDSRGNCNAIIETATNTLIVGCKNTIIPNSITTIGFGAFYECKNLTSIDIPNSVTKIDRYAFSECYSLTDVIISKSVSCIDGGAFSYCNNINNLVWNAKRCESNGDMPTSNIEHLTIGDEVEIIPNGFAYDSKISSITIPNSVTTIGERAFSGCIGLTSITIPESVTTIGERAFSGCIGLTSITIPESVTTIYNGAFYGCTGLKTLFYNAINCSFNDNGWCEGILFFEDCPIETIIIGDHVETIPYGLTINITESLTSVTIGNSVTTIGDQAFRDCSGLTSINIPSSVTSIGRSAFVNCSGLNRVNITDLEAWCKIDYEEIYPFTDGSSNPLLYAHHLFLNGQEVRNLLIPDGITEIKDVAFIGCTGITSITIPNSVTRIGDYAFNGCNGLTSIYIPNTITAIGYQAFHGTEWYNSLPEGLNYVGQIAYNYKGTMPEGTSITIQEGTLGIAGGAFLCCSGLTNVIIPNSVTSIGSGAFEECTGLTNITIPNSVTSLSNYVFGNCCNLTNVRLGNSITAIGIMAFNECFALTSINIPNSVTYIGGGAFYFCHHLKEVYSYITDLSQLSMDDNGCFYYLYYGDDEEEGIDYSDRTLYVPAGTSAAYHADRRWNCFGNIVEMCKASSIELDKTVSAMICGETAYLNATINPKNTIQMVNWASSNPAVAAVDENGLVTACGLGTATITASTTDGSNLSASCTVTVKTLSTDNCFVLPDTAVLHGENIMIPVRLNNTESVMAFQTDIYLPEGFTLVTDEDDEPMITPSSRLTSDHIIMADQLNDGGVRVICYNATEQLISDNEGDLFYITVAVPDEAGGAYPINLRNSLLTTVNYDELNLPDAGAVLTVNTFIPGDVNNSHNVNVTDIVVAAQYILQRNPDPFVFEAADMNGDGNVTVTDIMLIARLILYPGQYAPRRAPAIVENNDRMSGEDIYLSQGKTSRVSIVLDNEMDYSAFQLDLMLPDGLTASNFELTDRAGSHALDVETLRDGKLRALCYSPTIEAIDGNSGALLTFDVTATGVVTGDITVEGIELVTTDCQTVRLDAFTIGVNNATSVGEFAAGKTVARVDYYNVAGQRIDRPESGVTLVVTTYTDGTRTTTKLLHR